MLTRFALLAFVIGTAALVACTASDRESSLASTSAVCDSARAHAIALDTASRLDSMRRRVLAWHADDSGFVASTYPDPDPPAVIMDGGISVRIFTDCRIGRIVVSDSV